MGKVAATIEIKPKSAETDLKDVLDDVLGELPEEILVSDTETEEIGFGIEKLVVQFIVEDEETGIEAIEEAFVDDENVQSVDTNSVSRL